MPHDWAVPIHSSSRPSIREKNVCNRKNTGVTCAPIAAALCFSAAGTPRIPAESSNETRLPHRQPVRNVALPSRCGRMRAVEGLRQSMHAAQQRHTPRLILFRRSVTPISEARERPRIPIRGFFFFASAKNGRQTRFPERFFRIVASERARILRDAKGFALLFSGTRADSTQPDPSQQVPKHPAANVRTMKSAHGSRSRGIPPMRHASAASRCSTRVAATIHGIDACAHA